MHVRVAHKKNDDEGPPVIPDGATLQDSIDTFLRDFPNVKAIQIFTHGPSTKRFNNINIPALAKLRNRLNIYVHSTYLTSWGDEPRHFEHVCNQLIVSEAFGANGLVIHLPKQPPEFVAERVKQWLIGIKPPMKILLEVRSSRPDGVLTYETPKKILKLIATLMDANITHDQVGIILDTAHLAAALAPIVEYKSADNYLQALDHKKEWFPMLHLNGNAYDINVRAGDKHITPLSPGDNIWRNVPWEKSGCKAFVDRYKAWGADIILELDHHKESPRAFLRMISGELA